MCRMVEEQPESQMGEPSRTPPSPRSWRKSFNTRGACGETAGRNIAGSLLAREVIRQEAIHNPAGMWPLPHVIPLLPSLHRAVYDDLSSLRIVAMLFYQRLHTEKLLSQEELTLIFPDLRELIKIHGSLLGKMRDLLEKGPLTKKIGDLLLSQAPYLPPSLVWLQARSSGRPSSKAACSRPGPWRFLKRSSRGMLSSGMSSRTSLTALFTLTRS
ncbi:rho guanine nucleotide exchange factor 11 isoform X3 [Podarcis lilfordi]|uniref:Rho guanine nucleotide exchange factor 11 isoform X3 n=1 Tax=Podarcis lilfordi TaxID=74358 RepID=A0AA35PP97_9SAUR|nr:rho guanine nucleotide exchange factor 11 isoform X3 [Podarcis lilfordi]